MSTKTGWRDHAACNGHEETFFPEDPEGSGKWEEESEQECKGICANCPVQTQCAADILTDALGGQLPGIYAGMNRWERKWIIDNQQQTDALKAELDAASVSPVELRAWCQEVGPAFGISSTDTARSISDKFGYSESDAQMWLEQRGGTDAKRWVRPWSQAMRQAVAADPDRWWDQMELVEVGVHLVPQTNVETTRKSMVRARGACSERAARSKILQRAVAAAVASGKFEKRVVGGRVQVRASRPPVETRPSEFQATLFAAPAPPKKQPQAA